MERVRVIGAGLAGCEATWQLVKRGIPVTLYEMRPTKTTGAHQTEKFAELVCSNSMRSDSLLNAVGVLKEEMRIFDSVIIEAARAHQIPAGSALAVDREGFADEVTRRVKEHPLVEVIEEEITSIPEGPTIIATGPLTSDSLSKAIQEYIHEDYFYFYDAAAPIIEKDSIDFSKAYFKSRYDKGDADYINCPMTKEEFDNFYHELIAANTVPVKTIEKNMFFEGCMPFEEVARRGQQTLLFGAMKPVGLETPEGKRPYAVVQLRQDNAVATLYNIVGFQTHLTWGEQKRIISMIPGLENAEIVRYGVMHRNSYMCSPKVLRPTYQSVDRDDLFFAGQMTGVEGYVESAASGLVAGLNMYRLLKGDEPMEFPDTCIMGSMSHYITHASKDYFQPMNANFGILRFDGKVKKKDKKEAYSNQAISVIKELREQFND